MIKVMLVVLHSFYQSGGTVTSTLLFDKQSDCESARTALIETYAGQGSFFSGYNYILLPDDVACIPFKVDK